MMTMFRLGCSRMTIATLQVSEIAITMLTASVLATTASWLTFVLASDSLRRLLF
jgi:hypothetical protein